MRCTALLRWRLPKGGEAEALRFGAAVAGLKCTRIGGAGGMPRRAEVEALLAERRCGRLTLGEAARRL